MIINLERGFSTYTDSNNGAVNYYGKPYLYCWSGVKAGYLYTPLTEAKGGVVPSLDNVLVNTGKLHLYVAQNLPASTTVTVKRITEEWDYNVISDDDQPAVTATDQGTLLTSATAGTIIEIDIVDMIQSVVDNKEATGYIWYGVQVTVDKTSDCVFASWRNEGLSSRPFLELKYSVPPQQPTALRPMEGGVSTLTPVVGAMFFDDDSEDYCSKLQVQVNDTTDFSGTPDYDSGSQSTTKSSFELPGGAGLAWETLAYWRIRLGDSYGVWSVWSDVASITPLELPTITIEDLVENTPSPANYDFLSGVAGGWTLYLGGTGAAVKTQEVGGGDDGVYSCAINVTDNGDSIDDIELYKTAFSVAIDDVVMLRTRVRAIVPMTARLRFVKDSDPTGTVWITQDLSLTTEYQEFEFQATMDEATAGRVLLQIGNQVPEDDYWVEIDYLSVTKVMTTMAPNFHHHYTAGDNGAQIQSKHDLYFWNDAEIWERIGLTNWLADATLYSQTPNGTIHDKGVYRIDVRVQDGDEPREVVENGPVYAEDSATFEIIENENVDEISDPQNELETVYYDEHFTDIVYVGSWTPVINESAHQALHWDSPEDADDSASFVFYGSEVSWIGLKDDDMGIAEVFIDSVSKGTVDLYAAAPAWQEELYNIDSLGETESNGVLEYHTIKIVVTGTKHASSSGYKINLDAFLVTGVNLPILVTDTEEAELDDILGDDTYEYSRDGE